jgi:hypothetical protein
MTKYVRLYATKFSLARWVGIVLVLVAASEVVGSCDAPLPRSW